MAVTWALTFQVTLPRGYKYKARILSVLLFKELQFQFTVLTNTCILKKCN